MKEAAAYALSYIAKYFKNSSILKILYFRHTAELAQAVVDVGAVPLLVLCVQEPEIALKRISASALSEICKHTAELAQAVVDAGAVPFLSTLIPHPDSQLKRNVNQYKKINTL